MSTLCRFCHRPLTVRAAGPSEIIAELDRLKPPGRHGQPMCWPCLSRHADAHQITTDDFVFLTKSDAEGNATALRLVTDATVVDDEPVVAAEPSPLLNFSYQAGIG